MNKIIKYMESDTVMGRLMPVLGSEKMANSYIASALLAVSDSAELMKCSPDSIFQSVMRASILRLSLDKALGEAWIIPRWNNKKGVKEAVFQIGWAGYYAMAMRTREYRRIDKFKIDDGVLVKRDFETGKPLQVFDRESKGGWFAIFEMVNGYTKWIYWTTAEMDAHYKEHAPDNPVWKKHPVLMSEKTIASHLFKKWGVFDEKDQTVLNSLGENGEVSNMPEMEEGFYDAELISESVPKNNEEDAEEKVDPLTALGIIDAEKPKDDNRPYQPETLKKGLEQAAQKVLSSNLATKNQRGLMVGMYNDILGGDTNRYELCDYLYGRRKSSAMGHAQVLSALDHLNKNSEMAKKELLAAFKQSQIDKGQGELL